MMDACQEARLNIEYLNQWLDKGKRGVELYVPFYKNFLNSQKSFNDVCKKDFSEKEKEREKFLSYLKLGKTEEESKTISGITDNDLKRWFSFKNEKQFYSFYKEYNIAKEHNKFIREFKNNEDSVNKLIIFIKQGKNLNTSCRFTNLKLNKVKHWLKLGKDKLEPFTKFYNDFSSAEEYALNKKKENEKIKFDELIEKFINYIEYGYPLDVACEKVNIKSNEVFNWFSKSDNEEEFLIKYDHAKKVRENSISDFHENSNQIDIFLENIKNGKSKNDACNFVNIPLDDVDLWIDKGQKRINPYYSFYQSYNDAVKVYKKKTINNVGFDNSKNLKREKMMR